MNADELAEKLAALKRKYAPLIEEAKRQDFEARCALEKLRGLGVEVQMEYHVRGDINGEPPPWDFCQSVRRDFVRDAYALIREFVGVPERSAS